MGVSGTATLRALRKLTDLIQHFIALIKDEDLDVSESKLLVADKGIESAGCRNNDMWMRVLIRQNLNVFLHRGSTVEYCRLDLWHILAESCILVFDLIGQFARVTHDEH